MAATEHVVEVETPPLVVQPAEVGPNSTAAFASVMAEDVDAFISFPAPENIPQFEADSRFQVLVGSTEGETILSTNNTKLYDSDNM